VNEKANCVSDHAGTFYGSLSLAPSAGFLDGNKAIQKSYFIFIADLPFLDRYGKLPLTSLHVNALLDL